MDITLLAGSVVKMIGNWLFKTGGRVAERVADRAREEIDEVVDKRIDELYEAVRTRLSDVDDGKARVEAVEADPEDGRARTGLEFKIEEVLKRDPAFAERLADLLEQAQAAGGDTVADAGGITVHGGIHQTASDSGKNFGVVTGGVSGET